MALKGKVNIVGIVAWSLVVVLAIAAGALGFLGKKQSDRAAGLQDALQQVAATAGIQELASDAALPDVIQQVQTAIQGTQQELTTAQDSLTAAQAEASGAKAEAATLSQKTQEQTAAAEAAAKDLAAKDEAIAAAQAEAEKAAQEAKAVQEAADKQKAELEKNMASLKKRMEEQTARLQAELDAARAESVGGEEGQAPAEDVLVDALADASSEVPVVEEEPGRVIGQSTMISLIRYDEAEQSLFLRFLDGQELTYRDVPPAAYNQLILDGARVDIVYKFKIQGVYKSIPPDSTVVRKYLKWQRRNHAKDDVRVIELEAPLVIVDEAPAAEEVSAAEEPAETAASED